MFAPCIYVPSRRLSDAMLFDRALCAPTFAATLAGLPEAGI
jgi:hypothetical protein